MNKQPTNQPPEGRVFIADFKNKVVREKATMDDPGKVDANMHPEYIPEYIKSCHDFEDHIASMKQYPATWLTKEMDGEEMVEGKDFELQLEYKTKADSQMDENRIYIAAPPATVIQPLGDEMRKDIDRLFELKKWHMMPYNLGDMGEMAKIIDRLKDGYAASTKSKED